MKPRPVSVLLLLISAGASISASALEFGDLNNDGVITVQEIQAAREAATIDLLAEFDTDSDGELSAQERVAARGAVHAEIVDQFDSDEDGVLSADERRAARDEHLARFESNFDLDQDGQLSTAEWANLQEIVRMSVAEGNRGGTDEFGGQPATARSAIEMVSDY